MAVNKNYILDQFVMAKQYLEKAKEITEKPQEEFIEDFSLRLQAERVFEVIIQIMLDVCTHIVAKSNVPSPESYADCIDKLVKLQIIGEKANRYKEAVKMRNIIIHRYSSIDYELVYEGLKQIVNDFREYKQEILLWLNKTKNSNP